MAILLKESYNLLSRFVAFTGNDLTHNDVTQNDFTIFNLYLIILFYYQKKEESFKKDKHRLDGRTQKIDIFTQM